MDSLDRADDSKTDYDREPRKCGGVYVQHRTYTGPGCAMCGRSREEHSQGSEISEASTESVDGGSKTNGNISLLVCTQSSTIRSIQYEAETSVLIVAFKSGFSYQYDGVSKEAWDKFTSAESKGSHFAKEIKNRYTGRKL